MYRHLGILVYEESVEIDIQADRMQSFLLLPIIFVIISPFVEVISEDATENTSDMQAG